MSDIDTLSWIFKKPECDHPAVDVDLCCTECGQDLTAMAIAAQDEVTGKFKE